MGLETIRCNVCGAAVDKGTTTCPYCGCSVKGDGQAATVYTAETLTPEAEEEITSSFDYVNSFKKAQANPYRVPETKEEKTEAALVSGAKFFKLLMIIGIIRRLEALSSFLTGGVYKSAGATAEEVYAFYGNALRYLDIFYEIALVILTVSAVFGIVALSKFKSTACYWVVGTYAGSIVATLAMLIGRTVIFGVNNFEKMSVLGLAFSAFFTIVLFVYFKKTKHIFVN